MAALALPAVKLFIDKCRQQLVVSLEDSDVAGQRLRGLIISQSDRVEDKVDGLVYNDLRESQRYFKLGMKLFKKFLEENPDKSGDYAKRLSALQLGELETQSAKPAPSNSKGKEDYKTAMQEQFNKSAELALRAFNCTALKLLERVFAARLGIIATILEKIAEANHVQTVLIKCKDNVEILNSLSEVGNNLNTHFSEGTYATLRQLPGNNERTAVLWSVVSINRLLWNYAHACAETEASYFKDWPCFKVKGKSIHPVLDHRCRSKITRQASYSTDNPRGVSVTSNGCFVIPGLHPIDRRLGDVLEVLSSDRHCTLCETPPNPSNKVQSPEIKEWAKPYFQFYKKRNMMFFPMCIATVQLSANPETVIYAASSRPLRHSIDLPSEVYVFESNGQFQRTFGKNIFNTDSILTSMAINDNNEILVVDDHTKSLHAFTLNGDYIGKRVSWRDEHYGHGYTFIAVTSDHILLAVQDDPACVIVYDRDGKLIKVAKVSQLRKQEATIKGVAFDRVEKKVYLLCGSLRLEDTKKTVKTAVLLIYSEDQLVNESSPRPIGTIQLPKSCRGSSGIAVTSTGFVAVVDVETKSLLLV